LESWISPVAHARRFGRSHGLRAEGRKARFIHVAPRLSLTGSNADEWVAARPGTATDLALAMVNVLISEGQAGARGESIRSMVADYTPERAAERADVEVETIVRLAREFAGSPASLALPPGTEGTGTDATGAHIAVNLLNYVADNLGRTVRFGPNVLRRSASGLARTQAAADAMRGGEVELVFVHGADPVHTLPGGLEFATALDNVGLVVAFASYMDETAARADLILPDHTPLERWGDQEPEEGVHNLLQPTIRPIFDTKATPDALLSIAARVGGDVARALPWSDYRTYLREAWREIGREHAPGRPFEEFWQESLSRGGVWREVATRPVTLSTTVTNYDFRPTSLEGEQAAELALLTYPSPNLYDGRGANRPWLQELPDPMTKVVWNSWVEVHPETAEGMGVGTGDVVELTTQQGRLEAPVYVYEGIRRDAVAIPIGQGHRHYGRYARDRGVNPLELLPAAADLASGGAAWLSTRVRVRPVGRRERLVVTQGADTDHGRDIAELVGLSTAAEHERRARDEIRSNPDALVDAAEDADPKSPYRWGMVIDLASCTGCSACVTACYAENNVPVVGEANCANRREMSWIRIERYYEHLVEGNGHGGGHDGGSAAQHGAAAAVAGDGHTVHVPMLCQHCGNAPCEPVCPVYATYHNAEGLNVQVYNRCVGTRYCSNNCPYKVRRFEWFDYEYPFPLNLQLNPDVTVREKGVMEKCTFCVQRIQAAKYEAKAEGRPVADGEVVPACAQTCPTDAIVFGNLRDPNSRVSRLARSGRSYHVLEELNTRPAITYLEEVVRGPGEG
jgi:molybdopterin-containing oxidoreductase family iron-sulfur binding subunit